MSRAEVEVAGQRYTIGCTPGDEARLEALARDFDATMSALARKVGDIGGERLAVVAALSVLDRLAEAEAANERLTARIAQLEKAREAFALAARSDDDQTVERLEGLAATVERIALLINRDTRALSAPQKPKPVNVSPAPSAPSAPAAAAAPSAPATSPAPQFHGPPDSPPAPGERPHGAAPSIVPHDARA